MKRIFLITIISLLICLSPAFAAENNYNSIHEFALFDLDFFSSDSIDIDDLCIEKEKYKHINSNGKVNKKTNYRLNFTIAESTVDDNLNIVVLSYDKKGNLLDNTSEVLSGSQGDYSIDLNASGNVANSTLLVYDGDSLIVNKSTDDIKKVSKKVVDKQSSKKSSSKSASSATYWASSNSDKFHKTSCQWAQKISANNKVVFHSRSEALNSGYSPCKVCNP